jgi:hypothetical protein
MYQAPVIEIIVYISDTCTVNPTNYKICHWFSTIPNIAIDYKPQLRSGEFYGWMIDFIRFSQVYSSEKKIFFVLSRNLWCFEQAS